MPDEARPAAASDNRPRWIALAGWLIIALSAGAALLPSLGVAQGAPVIGIMLVAAGAVEFLAGALRRQTRVLAMAAGAITFVAGLLFATEPATQFASMLIIVAGWLYLRSFALGVASALERGSVRHWTGLAAAADFLLAFILTVGFSAAALVISLFGPTPPMIARFSWVLAISFVATGAMLLEVARCGRREDV